MKSERILGGRELYQIICEKTGAKKWWPADTHAEWLFTVVKPKIYVKP
ncbi:hypothetical protein [Liquorilactobacillus sucicola]|nr:hypothetical protein [Liquorilactobacillus sucicola]